MNTRTGKHRAPTRRLPKALGALALGAVMATQLVSLPEDAIATPGAWDFIGDGAVDGSTANPAHSWVGAQVWNDEVAYWCTMDAETGQMWVTGRNEGPSGYATRTVQGGSAYAPNSSTSDKHPSATRADHQRVEGGNTHRLAYLLDVYSDAALDGNASESASANWAMGALSVEGVRMPTISSANAVPGWITDRGQEIFAESAQFAGPYNVQPGISTADNGRTFDVTNIGVRAASGSWMPAEYGWTATIEGPGVWEGTDSATLTGSGQQSGAIVATGSGSITVTVTANNLPATSFQVHERESVQDFFSEGQPSSATGATDPVVAVTEFQPTVTTQISDAVVEPGSVLSDTVTSATAEDAEWIPGVTAVFDGTLYGPYDLPQAQSAEVPEDAPVVGTTSLAFTEAGQTLESEGIQVDEAGFYTWVWELDPEAQDAESAAFITGAWSDDFFRVAESGSVTSPIEITSQVDEDSDMVLAGDPVLDRIDISTTLENHGLFAPGNEGYIEGYTPDNTEVTHSLYGPFEAPATDETVVGEPVAQFVTEGTDLIHEVWFDTPETMTHAVDHYVIVSDHAGDARVSPLTTSPGDVLEQFRVVPNPTVTTQAKSDTFRGSEFWDTAVVEDPHDYIANHPEFDFEVRFELYGPSPIGDEAVCSPENLIANDAVQIYESGEYESGRFTIDGVISEDSAAYWVESLVRIDAEGNETELHRGECGIPEETTDVHPDPEVTSQAQSDVLIGDSASDTAIVTDEFGAFEVEGFEWEVSFEAFFAGDTQPVGGDDEGAESPSDGTTPEVTDPAAVCENEPFWTSDPVAVTGAGEYESGPSVATHEAGNIFWVETLVRYQIDADGNRGPAEIVHRGECGIPNETTEVHSTPSVVTQATPAIQVGDVAEDTATVTDDSGAIEIAGYVWHIEFNAYGPHADTSVDRGEPFFTSEDIPVDGSGDYLSGPTSPVNVAGNLYWVENLYRTPVDEDGNPIGDEELVHEGEYGIPNETTTVSENPPPPAADDGGNGVPPAADAGVANTGVGPEGWVIAGGVVLLAGAGGLWYWNRRRNAFAEVGTDA